MKKNQTGLMFKLLKSGGRGPLGLLGRGRREQDVVFCPLLASGLLIVLCFALEF